MKGSNKNYWNFKNFKLKKNTRSHRPFILRTPRKIEVTRSAVANNIFCLKTIRQLGNLRHTHTHVRTHTGTHVRTRAHTHTHAHAHAHVHMHTCAQRGSKRKHAHTCAHALTNLTPSTHDDVQRPQGPHTVGLTKQGLMATCLRTWAPSKLEPMVACSSSLAGGG